MRDIYGDYRKLRKSVFRSYWEKRILAEIGYLLELLDKEEILKEPLIEQAVDLLMEDYRACGQINVPTAQEAERVLLPLSERAKELTVLCVAHAHIDMNWMWGFQETVAVTLDTVRTMLALMEEYPQFTFSQSQASVYHMLEEYAPRLLEQVKRRVREGRWEVTASTWVENDKNLSGGESMARHLLYTKKYLSGLLDIREEDLNLDFEPDTFGHSYNLPEILRNGGVTRYYHCRGYDEGAIYRWRGLSGAEVLSYCERTWYNAGIDSDFCEGIPTFCRKYNLQKLLKVYGVGDHGGGPTRRDIERFLDMNTWPLYPVIRFGTYREFFDYLEERKDQFPVVDQELNYVFTGCYTSQSRIKMANRFGEARLTESEILESMASLEVPGYERGKNPEDAWRKILFNQFHDIIPGSGVVETREYALGEFQSAMARAGANGTMAMEAICEAVAEAGGVVCKAAAGACGAMGEAAGERLEKNFTGDRAMGAGAGKGTERACGFGFAMPERGGGPVRHLVLFNVTQTARTEPTEIILWDWQEEISHTRITDLNGKEYPFQFIGREEDWEGLYWGHTCDKLLVWVPVPPLGYTICRIEGKETEGILVPQVLDVRKDNITDEPICLENDKVKAVFEVSTMKCISFVQKSDGRQLVAPERPACGLALITEEDGNELTAWRVGRTSKLVDLNEQYCVKPLKLTTEGLRKELEYEIAIEKTKINVKIRLDEGSQFLDYRLEAAWTLLGEEGKGIPQLRFMVPCGYEMENYRYTIPYGVIDRPPLAQDVPAMGLGCALPKDGKSALYLLSDCKYGFRGDREGLSLNLIRGSYDPDPYPEIGDHIIRIAVGVCQPKEETLALLAERYLHPVTVRSCGAKPSGTEGSKSLFEIEGAVLSSIKEAEDGHGLIIRMYNPSHEERVMRLRLPGHRMEAYLADFLENNLKPLPIEAGDTLTYRVNGSGVCSFRILLRS